MTDSSFGSTFLPSPIGTLTAQELASFSQYVNQKNNSEKSSDDLFDDAAYRTSQVTFAAKKHRLQPKGQTFYRRKIQYTQQGLPPSANTSHWDFIPSGAACRPLQTGAGSMARVSTPLCQMQFGPRSVTVRPVGPARPVMRPVRPSGPTAHPTVHIAQNLSRPYSFRGPTTRSYEFAG